MKPFGYILFAAIIIASVLGIYGPALSAPFIFDDPPSITENPYVHHLWPLWEAIKVPARSNLLNRPVVSLSLAIGYALHGDAVEGYRGENILIHLACVWILFGILIQTLKRWYPEPRNFFMVFLITWLWAVHPLHTETVIYVIQRSELLQGLFYLLTVFFFLKSAATSSPGKWQAFSILSCSLGMFTKQSMISCPVVILLFDRVMFSGSFRRSLQARKIYYLGLFMTPLIAAAGLILHPPYETLGDDMMHLKPGTSLNYLKQQTSVLLQYLKLVFWPHPLIVDYGDLPKTVTSDTWLLPGAGLLILGILTIILLIKNTWMGFVGACFFVMLAPTSSFFPIVTEYMAERRMYLVSALIVTLSAVGTDQLLRRILGARLKRTAALTIPLLLVLISPPLIFASFTRGRDYESRTSIWQDAVNKKPDNPRAHYNLAVALLEENHDEQAKEHLLAALELNPEYADAHNNMGFLLAREGNNAEARAHYLAALKLVPLHSKANYNLGELALKENQREEALRYFQEDLKLYPDQPDRLIQIGTLFLKQNRIPAAIDYYQGALILDPENEAAHINLGIAYYLNRNFDKARNHFEKIQAKNPEHETAKKYLEKMPAGNPPESTSAPQTRNVA